MIKEFFKNKKDNLSSTLKILLLVAILAFLTSVNINLYKQNKEKDEQLNQLRSELDQKEERFKDLEESISEVEREEYWESRIREQGYKKPGEEQVVVLPSEEKDSNATTTEDLNFWDKIKERFNNLISF